MKTKLTPAAVAISLSLFLAAPGNAQTPSFQWAKRVASTINTDDELSIGMTLDSQDNVYVTGWFDGTNDFGGVTLTNKTGGGQDIFVAKYNSTGALQWARRAGGNSTGWDGGRGIGVDNAGNVYVTGQYYGTADFGAFTLTGGNFFLAKYDSAGTVLWVRQNSFGGYGTGLAVDGKGNCYAVGYAGGPTFLVKYDNTGSNQWTQLMGGGGNTYSANVAVDAAGNVYMHESFTANITVGTNNLVISPGSMQNMFVAKFNNSGALVWVQQTGGNGSGEGGVAVDQAGNVYVTGLFRGSTMTFGTNVLMNAGAFGAYVAKYNSSGQIQWARRAGGTNGGFYVDAALDWQGNVYTAGFLSPDGVASSDAMIAKYDPSGTLQWSSSSSSPPASPVGSIVAKCAVDSTGNCYLAGWYLLIRQLERACQAA